MFLWTAFTIGLLGSLHCVGMCGPIALALPIERTNKWRSALNVLNYNLGRVITYAFLGTLIGLIGKGIFLAGIQAYFSIGLGVFLLIVAIFSINVEGRLVKNSYYGRFSLWVRGKLGKLLSKGGGPQLFKIGILNGFLPCGLVYMAVVGAVSMGSIVNGALYMMLFGLGTIPLMFITALAGQWVSISFRNRLKKLYPVFLVAFALLFIFRGLQFDIPLDFRFWQEWNEVPMCH